MIRAKNGNATIFIYENGVRKIFTRNKLKLEYPLNIDIRVQAGCSLATTICKDFCHEAPEAKGREADYDKLYKKLKSIPLSTEIAIGCNYMSDKLYDFIFKMGESHIVNVTMNMAHFAKYGEKLFELYSKERVMGIGVSYRKGNFSMPATMVNNIYKFRKNSILDDMILHVIIGIDDIDDILSLDKEMNYEEEVNDLGLLSRKFIYPKKLLILGEKNFGFNLGKVDTSSESHAKWRAKWRQLADKFDNISFDNLALQQLDIQNQVTPEAWEQYYTPEKSIYMNAVDEYYSPSSRSNEKHDYNLSVKNYFKFLENGLQSNT